MLMLIRIFVIFNLSILWYLIDDSNCESANDSNEEFCRKSEQNVMSNLQSPGNTGDCINYENLIETEKEKLDVLERLNSRRNKVASGEIRSLPPAENMLKLEWDDELEALAQRSAAQCIKSNFYDVTDSRGQILENTSVGQNIGTIYGFAPGLTAQTLVDLWYMELLNMNASYLSRYKPSSTNVSLHYDFFTQLVWAETSRVGCAGVRFKKNKMESNRKSNRTVYKLICNFAPSGNIVGQTVYSDGIPCSRCPSGSQCDTEYRYLCTSQSDTTVTEFNDDFQLTKEYANAFIDSANVNDFVEITGRPQINDGTTTTILKEEQPPLIDITSENDTSFDFLSHLFDITSSRLSSLRETTLPCKGMLAVDDFIKLLKNKLSNDQSLKDLLMSTSKMSTPDPNLTDRTVAAIINQLYSKKEITTISKTTRDDVINSTLLADLVEAVIFRHNDRFSTTTDVNLNAQSNSNIRPVKIKAELAEVKANTEFTGHFFFPEEEEQTEPEMTECYDDLNLENLPISEISLEIKDLKRNKQSKDFLEEILESDLMNENDMDNQHYLNNNNVTFVPKLNYSVDNHDLFKHPYSKHEELKRIRRKLNNYVSETDYDGVFIEYNNLLKKLAADLRNLQLNEKFHCGFASVNSTNNFLNNKYFFIVVIYTMLYNMSRAFSDTQ